MIRMHASLTSLLAVLPLLATTLALGNPTASPGTPIVAPSCEAASDLDKTSASCGKCHRTIYEQWQGSRHAAAWTNQAFKDWMAEKSKPESCHKCHIPDSVLDIAPKQPKPREDRLEEGVGCASCHVLDGKVHGPHGKSCDAHESVKSKLFDAGSIDLCQSCHRVAPKPVISLGKDFEKSDLAKEGKNCRTCHMPDFEGHATFDEQSGEPIGEKRKIKSHAFVGASHKEMTAKAFELKAQKTEKGWKLSLHNLCGHRLPGLELRRYTLRFSLVDAASKELSHKEAVISEDEPIKLGASIDVELTSAEAAQHASVKIHHSWQAKPKGPWEDKGLVYEATLPLGVDKAPNSKKDG